MPEVTVDLKQVHEEPPKGCGATSLWFDNKETGCTFMLVQAAEEVPAKAACRFKWLTAVEQYEVITLGDEKYDVGGMNFLECGWNWLDKPIPAGHWFWMLTPISGPYRLVLHPPKAESTVGCGVAGNIAVSKTAVDGSSPSALATKILDRINSISGCGTGNCDHGDLEAALSDVAEMCKEIRIL